MNSQRFDEETLTSSLKLLAGQMATLNAPPEIEQKLREAMRARAVVRPFPKRRVGYWVAAGIAAALLIAVSVVALRPRTDKPNQTTARQTDQPAVKEERSVEVPKILEPEPEQEPQKQIARNPVRPGKRRVPHSEVANHVTREIATDFMPLGYVNPTTFQDGGQVVRIELPRSALVNFGLPMNMERYHEKVKADVLIGSDGLAHAIRFVQ